MPLNKDKGWYLFFEVSFIISRLTFGAETSGKMAAAET
jgi:hypothetical protein